MTLQCDFKVLLFSVFFLFCQQGMANDTYDLEEFCQYYKKIWEPSSKRRQKGSGDSIMNPFKIIRIGFFGLNLAADDVSGDDRLEIYNNFLLDEQNFEYLSNFYFYYVNIGSPQYRHARIQKILRLIFRIFTMNVTMENSPAGKQKINAMARSLFDKLFFSPAIDAEINPYYTIFNSHSEKNLPDYATVHNGLVLMFFAFLGPHVLSTNAFYDHFSVLLNRFTRKSYHEALSNSLLSGNTSDYQSPKRFANRLKEANLDTETALLIGLYAMASASHHHMATGMAWPETLEELLQRFLPYELLCSSYENMNSLCQRESRSRPEVMFSYEGMRDFTYNILGIDPTPPAELDEEACSQSGVCRNLSDPSPQNSSSPRDTASDWSLDSEDSDEEIAQKSGAVGGATRESQECSICSGPLEDKTIFINCRHLGYCEVCIENILKE